METFLEGLRPGIEALLALSVAVYVLGALWLALGMRAHPPQGRREPLVSIVVAARDEEGRIGACLDDLLAQDYPRCEIIVVDDGSRDGTAAQVRRRCGKSGGRLRLFSTAAALGESGSKKAALGLGIEAAQGELILTTDADCRTPRGWVRGVVACFAGEVGMVLGFSQIGAPGRVRGWRAGWEAVDFLCLMAGALGSVGRGHPLAASGQNLAYRKEVFRQVGGFDRIAHRASGDDVLLLQLVRRLRTWRIAFATAADTFVVHPPATSWGALLAQRVRWASNAPCQLRLDPLLFVYLAAVFGASVLLALAPLWMLAGGAGWAWLGAGWGAKVAADGLVFWRGMRFFGRRDLLRYFPLWTLSQPFYLSVVGVLGVGGRFEWKGKVHQGGEKRMRN